MDLCDLIEQLTAIANELESIGLDNPKIVVAQQPSYPLEGKLRGVVNDDGKIVLVSGEATEYSSSDYWEQI